MKQKKQKYLKSDGSVRFHTFKVFHPGLGRVLTRIVVAVDKTYLMPIIGIAYCSVDDQFTKVSGRALAQERMLDKDRNFMLAIPDNNRELIEQIKDFIIGEVKHKKINWLFKGISVLHLK